MNLIEIVTDCIKASDEDVTTFDSGEDLSCQRRTMTVIEAHILLMLRSDDQRES